jgi:hypothetical protein
MSRSVRDDCGSVVGLKVCLTSEDEGVVRLIRKGSVYGYIQPTGGCLMQLMQMLGRGSIAIVAHVLLFIEER